MSQNMFPLPRLNGLNPTLESTLLKLVEELGEVSRVVGKFRGMSGESPQDSETINRELALEFMDVMQTVTSFMYVLSDMGLDLNAVYEEHIEKLKRKGYLVDKTRE